MRILIIAALLVALGGTQAMAGNCDHSWQTDKNGHACGDRAADRRPGGN